jgi:hypothetical protein
MNLIDRRLFISGLASSLSIPSAFAQSDSGDFKRRYDALFTKAARVHPGMVREYRVIALAGNSRPWTASGMYVAKGEPLTILGSGRICVNKTAELYMLPRALLWARIGRSDVQRLGSDTRSLQSPDDGPLHLATLQGRWTSHQGDHSASTIYDRMQEGLDLVVIRWGNDRLEENLRALSAMAPGDALIAQELGRLAQPLTMPAGFADLWNVGSGANFNQVTENGVRVIQVRSQQNGGIIKAPVDLPLERGMRLKWDWRVNQLPSTRAEDATPRHQYTSIALEFEDGQDLTWYWSAELESGKHYQCPFGTWPKETHLVVRSGLAQQGAWVREARDVFADVERALPSRPSRVTGLWLIAATVFGDRPASVDYRDISVEDANGHARPIFALRA